MMTNSFICAKLLEIMLIEYLYYARNDLETILSLYSDFFASLKLKSYKMEAEHHTQAPKLTTVGATRKIYNLPLFI